MRLVMVMALAALMTSPLSVSAQDAEESAAVEPSAEEAAPSPEPAPEEPALELELDDGSVNFAPGSYRLPDRVPTFEEMELRVKRAKIGLGASAGVAGAGMVLTIVALGALSGGEIIGGDTPDWAEPAAVAGGSVMGAGVVGMVTAGAILAHRKRKLRRLREAHYGTREVVDVDTSDDAFTVIVTRKYDEDELTGATVFIRHKESGKRAKPYIDAAEIDSLDQVIREHKAKLLSGE